MAKIVDSETQGENNQFSDIAKKKKPTCGIIMPISSNDECSAEHWLEVLEVLKQVGEDAEFETNLVSTADHTSVIQRTIVQNVFASDIVICDVSCKNPNVMFELGMRLAFDKATVIIKDDVTGYSFDTGIIEHLEYPRGLRLGKMNKFKEDLTAKLKSTYQKSLELEYSMFLHNFGTFKVAKLEETEVAPNLYILEVLQGLQKSVDEISRKSLESANHSRNRDSSNWNVNSDKTYENPRAALEYYVYGRLKLFLDINPGVIFTSDRRKKFIKEILEAPESQQYLQGYLLPEDEVATIVRKYFKV